MINPSQKIGIWGFGIVGKSVLRYLLEQGFYQISVMDKRPPTQEEIIFLHEKNVKFFSQDQLSDFLTQHEIIIPSPGIDLRAYGAYQEKFFAELDLFYYAWHNRAPIIAITGTIGKTSITHILSELLKKAGKKVFTGGNIGTGMLDLIGYKGHIDYVVIELSSFQLAQTKFFAPDVAIWTNLYPKHLDRHGTVEEYFSAKSAILLRQHGGQYALIPQELFEKIEKLKISGRLSTFSLTPQTENARYYLCDNAIIKHSKDGGSKMVASAAMPTFSFPANWLIIAATLDILGFSVGELLAHSNSIDLPDHRLNFIARINDIEFYDDSKSTIMQAVHAAVDRLSPKPIILLLGGVSDAGDRSFALHQLAGKVAKIICFGAEAQLLAKACGLAVIDADAYPDLERAFYAACDAARPGSCVLLSPGGPSFDLFKDYTERGKRFCQLVDALKNGN